MARVYLLAASMKSLWYFRLKLMNAVSRCRGDITRQASLAGNWITGVRKTRNGSSDCGGGQGHENEDMNSNFFVPSCS